MFAVLRAGEQQDLGLLGLCAPFGAGWNEPQPLSCWPEHIQALPWWKFPSQGLCRMRSSTAALPYNPQLAPKFSVFKAQNPLKTPPQTLGVTPAALPCEHHSSFLCSIQIFFFFPSFSAQLLISAGSRSRETCPRMSQRQRILGRP